jgi:hypothetical protein
MSGRVVELFATVAVDRNGVAGGIEYQCADWHVAGITGLTGCGEGGAHRVFVVGL